MNPSTKGNLVDEYRVRLELDNNSSCTFTSNEPAKMETYIKKLLPQVNFTREDAGVAVTYSDSDGNRHSAWIAGTQIPQEHSVTNFNQIRKTAQRQAA